MARNNRAYGSRFPVQMVFPKLSERGLRNLFASIDERATRKDSIRASAGVGDARLPAREA